MNTVGSRSFCGARDISGKVDILGQSLLNCHQGPGVCLLIRLTDDENSLRGRLEGFNGGANN